MRCALICTTALIIGFVSGGFVAVPFFAPSNITSTLPTSPLPTVPLTPEQPDGSTSLPLPTDTPISSAADFDSALTYAINETVTYPDGLIVTLTAINDSRCKPEVQCIWAGELAPQLTLTGGDLGESQVEVSLGTSRTQSHQTGLYSISLGETALTTATLTVTKDAPATVSTKATPKPTTRATTVTPKQTTAVVKPTTDLAVEVAKLLTDATKKLRTEKSLTSYSVDTKLAASAKKYSSKLLAGNYLAHTDKSGCDLTCRFDESGYQASSWGENLAMMEYDEQPSAEYIANYFMTQWQKSAGHRKNLLSSTFTNQGIGVSVQNGKIYVAVHFALPN